MMFFRKKALLAKIESTYGTDPTPTGAANAIEAEDIRISPMMGSDLDRGLERPWMGNTGTIPNDVHTQISFAVQMTPASGAGVVPGWGVLLRGCSMAETVTASTSVIYNPITTSPESVTLYLNIDGTLHKLLGARGTVDWEIAASNVPRLRFTFTGLWSTPVAQALPTPDYSGYQLARTAAKANTPIFTIGGVALIPRSFTLRRGNTVTPRFDITAEDVLITDQKPQCEAVVRAVPLATYNPYAKAMAMAPEVIQLRHGTTVGQRITLDIPRAQPQRMDNLGDGDGLAQWTLRHEPLPAAGADDFTLTLN